jgi:hypothetical protein
LIGIIDGDEWNENLARSSLGQAETKRFEQNLALLLQGEQLPPPAPPSQPFHMGNGDFHWDIKTRFVKFFVFFHTCSKI